MLDCHRQSIWLFLKSDQCIQGPFFFKDLNTKDNVMKNVLVLLLFAVFLAACASSQESGNKVADAGSGPRTEKVCETVRTNETGARLRRVCREVVVDDAEGQKAEGS